MTAFSRSALAGAIMALAAVAALASAANAQTAQHRSTHKKVPHPALVGLDAAPPPPGVELQTSASAVAGSENHYFSDTVAAGQNDLKDHAYRYGQPSSARYSNTEPLFRF
jgi:hypothetical protein